MLSCQLCVNALKAVQKYRSDTSSKKKTDAVHTFKQFLSRNSILKSMRLFLAIYLQLYFIPNGSCLASPAQIVMGWTLRGTPGARSIFSQCSLSKCIGVDDGGEEQDQKGRHALFRTNGLDYRSWRCYKTDGLQAQHFWDLNCLASTVLSLCQLPLSSLLFAGNIAPEHKWSEAGPN